MKTFKHNGQESFCCRLLHSRSGFTLMELMIAVIITTVTLLGVTGTFRTFTRHSSTTFQENERNASVKATLQLLKRDLNMAGFGLAAETRIAELDQFETAVENNFTNNYDFNGDGDSTDNITEISLNYDLNGDGTIAAAGTTPDPVMYRDRLFIADGWTILEDITDNGASDGTIVEGPPIDYFYEVANKKEACKVDIKETCGYDTSLSAAAALNDTSLQLTALNINTGFEFQAPAPDNHKGENDFTAGAALIGSKKDKATKYLCSFNHPFLAGFS